MASYIRLEFENLSAAPLRLPASWGSTEIAVGATHSRVADLSRITKQMEADLVPILTDGSLGLDSSPSNLSTTPGIDRLALLVESDDVTLSSDVGEQLNPVFGYNVNGLVTIDSLAAVYLLNLVCGGLLKTSPSVMEIEYLVATSGNVSVQSGTDNKINGGVIQGNADLEIGSGAILEINNLNVLGGDIDLSGAGTILWNKGHLSGNVLVTGVSNGIYFGVSVDGDLDVGGSGASGFNGGVISGDVSVSGTSVLTLNGVTVLGGINITAGATVNMVGGSLIGAQTGAGTYNRTVGT